MQLITGRFEIEEIVARAVGEFRRSFKHGLSGAKTEECSTPFWREVVYDLVRLALVATPIAEKLDEALEKQHLCQETYFLDFWLQETVNMDCYQTIRTYGLSSLDPVAFMLFSLWPSGIFTAHCMLEEEYQHLSDSGSSTSLHPEWVEARLVAEYYQLLKMPASLKSGCNSPVHKLSPF